MKNKWLATGVMAALGVTAVLGQDVIPEDADSFEVAPVSQTDRRGVRVEGGLGVMAGHTTYQIGGDYKLAGGPRGSLHFPISELEFPLNSLLAHVGLSADAGRRVRLAARFSKNLLEDAGTMEDSDWMTTTRRKDVYSESDAELDAFLFNMEATVKYMIFRHGSLSAGLGYRHHYFDYDIKDLHQWYPSRPWLAHEYVDGLVLTYEVMYAMPYICLGGEWRITDWAKIEAALGVGFVYAADEDNHILRDKISESTAYGYGVQFALKGHFDLWRQAFVTIALEASSQATTGTQKQYFMVGGEKSYFGEIDYESASDLAQISLLVGRCF